MPIIPSLIERLILLRLNQGPGVMLDFLGAQAFRAVSVAVKLGVFEALADGPRTAPQVAECIQASERGTSLLLDALESLGYVRQKGGHYANTPMTAKWGLRGSPTSLAGAMPFFESMVFDRWGHLDESIRRGEPAVYGSEWLEQHPEGYRIYEEAMLALSRITADEVIARVKLPRSARRLLDGGGLIVIMEQLIGKTSGSFANALARLQALNFFNDLNAQTYSFDEIATWRAEASFTGARRIDLLRAPGFSLVLATRAG